MNTSRHIDLSVVIPVYNAEECIEELYKRLKLILSALRKNHEIIFVEDCGQDNSWQILSEICETDDQTSAIKLSRNFGQHNAITAGIAHATGEWIVLMDCDLQDKPEDILKLLEKSNEGFDVVIAKSVNNNRPTWKKITAEVFYKFFSFLTPHEYTEGIRTFRLISKKVGDAFLRMGEQVRSTGPLGIWMGFDTAYIEIETANRFSGQSSYDARKLLSVAALNIISFSDKPLKASISIGFAISAFSLLFGLHIVIRYVLYGISIVGWASLITSTFFMGGIILFQLGIIGVYIGRVFDEVKNRPHYLIAKKV